MLLTELDLHESAIQATEDRLIEAIVPDAMAGTWSDEIAAAITALPTNDLRHLAAIGYMSVVRATIRANREILEEANNRRLDS